MSSDRNLIVFPVSVFFGRTFWPTFHVIRRGEERIRRDFF